MSMVETDREWCPFWLENFVSSALAVLTDPPLVGRRLWLDAAAPLVVSWCTQPPRWQRSEGIRRRPKSFKSGGHSFRHGMRTQNGGNLEL